MIGTFPLSAPASSNSSKQPQSLFWSMSPFFITRHPVQLARRFWIRLVRNLYLLALIMWSIRNLFYPLKRILLRNLQNSSLPTVFVSYNFLLPIHVIILYLHMSMSSNGLKIKHSYIGSTIDSMFFTGWLLQHELRRSEDSTRPSMPSTVQTYRPCRGTHCLTDDAIITLSGVRGVLYSSYNSKLPLRYQFNSLKYCTVLDQSFGKTKP